MAVVVALNVVVSPESEARGRDVVAAESADQAEPDPAPQAASVLLQISFQAAPSAIKNLPALALKYIAPSTADGFPASDFLPTTKRSGVVLDAPPIITLPVPDPAEAMVKSPVVVDQVEAALPVMVSAVPPPEDTVTTPAPV